MCRANFHECKVRWCCSVAGVLQNINEHVDERVHGPMERHSAVVSIRVDAGMGLIALRWFLTYKREVAALRRRNCVA